MTSRRFFTDSITAPTMVFRPATETRLIFASHTPIRTGVPGIMATVLSARKTRNVRSAARLPRSIPIVTYLFRCFAAVMSQTHAQKDNTQTQTHERERNGKKKKERNNELFRWTFSSATRNETDQFERMQYNLFFLCWILLFFPLTSLQKKPAKRAIRWYV